MDRIERQAGVPGALPPADLRSLLLEVHRRQASRLTPAQVLAQYRRDRFTGVVSVDPVTLADFDRFAFETLRARGYTPVELSPVSPLGTVSVVSSLDQNLVVTTGRGTEVIADSTNVLALESAMPGQGRERVRLRASRILPRAATRANPHPPPGGGPVPVYR